MAEVKILIKGEEVEEKKQMEQFIKSLNYGGKMYLRGFLNGIHSNVEMDKRR